MQYASKPNAEKTAPSQRGEAVASSPTGVVEHVL